MKKIALFWGLLAITSAGFTKSMVPMNSLETQNALIDKTITTIPISMIHGKTIHNTYTAYFGKDGKCYGKFSKKPDGWPQSDKGTWKAKNNSMLCFTWEHWSYGEEVCILFYKLNNGILIVKKNDDFDTFILNRDIQSGNKM